ncbi:Hypothetical predicted protein [Cloeon dipterum]|uniref:Lipocalin/cytosolic fatty-acid binding domain-containing protein n=1 Tax=Cloeon dipterum TaxID=197152 RepID=A0A8S1DQP2_9INSE|nr:Hypothetical predicted protein [Cloeon dipterum]
MRAVFALVAIFLSLAPAFSEDTCPTFSYMKPFDAAKYAGKWYSVAYKEHPTHPGQMSCGKIEIAHSKNVGGKDTLVYKYNYVENGQLGTAHKVAQALHSENPGRFQSVWRMDGASTWSSEWFFPKKINTLYFMSVHWLIVYLINFKLYLHFKNAKRAKNWLACIV